MVRPKREVRIGALDLMLIRKMLLMNMTEAAEVLCHVKQRSYHQYESGLVGIPKKAEDLVIKAVKKRETYLLSLKSDNELLEVMPLEDWLAINNPNHKELLECKLDWFIDVSTKAEMIIKSWAID